MDFFVFMAGLLMGGALGAATVAGWAEKRVAEIAREMEGLKLKYEPYRPGPWNNWGQG